MKIMIHANGCSTTPVLEAYVHQRLRFALMRLISHPDQTITLTLSDENGRNKKGIDKLCRVSMVIPNKSPIIIRSSSDDFYKAIDSAAKRLRQTISRQLKKPLASIKRKNIKADVLQQTLVQAEFQ